MSRTGCRGWRRQPTTNSTSPSVTISRWSRAGRGVIQWVERRTAARPAGARRPRRGCGSGRRASPGPHVVRDRDDEGEQRHPAEGPDDALAGAGPGVGARRGGRVGRRGRVEDRRLGRPPRAGRVESFVVEAISPARSGRRGARSRRRGRAGGPRGSRRPSSPGASTCRTRAGCPGAPDAAGSIFTRSSASLTPRGRQRVGVGEGVEQHGGEVAVARPGRSTRGGGRSAASNRSRNCWPTRLPSSYWSRPVQPRIACHIDVVDPCVLERGAHVARRVPAERRQRRVDEHHAEAEAAVHERVRLRLVQPRAPRSLTSCAVCAIDSSATMRRPLLARTPCGSCGCSSRRPATAR